MFVRVVLLVALLPGCRSGAAPAGPLALDAATGDTSFAEGGLAIGAINGTCASEGVKFKEVYSCKTVVGPRGDAELEATAKVAVPDPDRFDDLDGSWVESQISSCSCVCCHGDPDQSAAEPSGEGRYVWSRDFSPAWVDSATNRTLRILAGFEGPMRHGPSGPSNNGFSRAQSGLPTTDADRLKAFVQRELDRRAATP